MTETKFIEQLFFNQIKDVTMKSAANSFDYQFSGDWTQR